MPSFLPATADRFLNVLSADHFRFGKQFYTLLDEAAVAASDAAKALHSMLREADRQPALDAFKLARLRERAA